jgi:hypothetical protein
MGKSTEEKAAETRAEARRHREENYAVKRDAGFQCGEEGCRGHTQLLVVELPAEGEADFELGVRCSLHLGTFPIRPFQFNEGSMADKAA